MKKRTQIGLVLTIVPPALFLLTLILYPIVNYAFASMTLTDASAAIGNLINFFLGLMGFVGLGGSMIGVPIGIYYLVTADKEPKKK